MRTPTATPTVLNSLELTGRARTHVQEDPALRCTLHPQALYALKSMGAAAREAGIELQAVSSFRDFDRQLAIWNGKFHGQRPLLDRAGKPLHAAELSEAERIRAILLWSALPGASRHHWGTDCDVIDARARPENARVELLSTDFSSAGCFAPLHAWLDAHAADFGFFRPYDADRGGVQPEPWHLSFAPLSVPALAAMSLSLLREALGAGALAGLAAVNEQLAEIFGSYVLAVAQPPPAATLAAALNRAARPA